MGDPVNFSTVRRGVSRQVRVKEFCESDNLYNQRTWWG